LEAADERMDGPHMTAMNQPPGGPDRPGPPGNLPPAPVRESVGTRSGRWPWIVGAVVIAAIVGVGVSWLLATTVSQSAYDDATAELASAEADVARLEEQVAALEDEVSTVEADNRQLATDSTALRADVTRLTGEAATVRDAAALALVAAEAQAYDSLNTGTELPTQLDAGAADFTDADALLAELGHEGTFKEWAAQDESYYATDRAMAAVDDDRLWDAWQRWYNADVGSPQEQAAYFEYLWRLHRLVVESLGATQE
jgi:hypothetical protein